MTPNIDKIIEHYNYAREKHPYFADRIPNCPDLPYVSALVSNFREEIVHRATIGQLDVYALFSYKWFGLIEEYLKGNTPAAIKKAYDCIAVLLRTIDVLEGRQKLGMPEEEAHA